MHNEYLEDALYCLRRASRALSDHMGRDSLYDATAYFAFGIEKLCKAVVYDVNPLFLLENPKFENAIVLLYRDRLLESARKRPDERDLNRHLLPFRATLFMAGRFSQVIEDNIGAFTHLGDLRGIVAHRSINEMDTDEAGRFLVKTFHPLMHRLAEELDFDPSDCFDDAKKETQLEQASEAVLVTEDFKARVEAKLQEARERWKRIAEDEQSKQAAAVETAEDLIRHKFQRGGPYFQSTDCPACGQHALLLFQFIDRVVEDGIATIGAYAIGLWCHYCKLTLHGYGEVDHFKLNERLASFNPRK